MGPPGERGGACTPGWGAGGGAGEGSLPGAVSTALAGAFSLLREKFSHAPSPDMSPASLRVLEQLMAAQAQECVFEGLSLPGPAAPHDRLAQLRLAQEAAQVRTGAPVPGGSPNEHPGPPPSPPAGRWVGGACKEMQRLRLLLVPGPWGAGGDPGS